MLLNHAASETARLPLTCSLALAHASFVQVLRALHAFHHFYPLSTLRINLCCDLPGSFVSGLVSLVVHFAPLQPALCFLSGRYGCTSQHEIFKPPHPSSTCLKSKPFSLRQKVSLLLPLATPCCDLAQSTTQHKLRTTIPTSADHISTVPPHCSASATRLGATHGLVES